MTCYLDRCRQIWTNYCRYLYLVWFLLFVLTAIYVTTIEGDVYLCLCLAAGLPGNREPRRWMRWIERRSSAGWFQLRAAAGEPTRAKKNFRTFYFFLLLNRLMKTQRKKSISTIPLKLFAEIIRDWTRHTGDHHARNNTADVWRKEQTSSRPQLYTCAAHSLKNSQWTELGWELNPFKNPEINSTRNGHQKFGSPTRRLRGGLEEIKRLNNTTRLNTQ